MRRTNTAFYEGFVSSFFLQPLQFTRKTQHQSYDARNIGSLEQDWQNIGGDFKRASEKVLKDLEPSQARRLQSMYYHHV